MNLYLDSSVAVHVVIPDGDPRAGAWLRDASADDLWSSALLRLELVRVMRRDGVDVGLAAAVLDRVSLVSLDDEVLAIAEAIEPHVKLLDAIHLATCLLLGEGVVVVSHDDAMRRAAEHLGLESLDPMETAA